MKHARILPAMLRSAMQTGLLLIALLGAVAVGLPSVRAATITVTNTNDSGVGSLRQALAAANDGDTIDFSVSGTITLTTGQLVVDKNVSISGPGAANLAVNGNAATRVFYIGSYTASKIVSMSGLTITNGVVSGDYGGGIYNNRSTLTVSNCTLSGNSAEYHGGGIYNDHATLTVSNSTLSGNSSPQGGGGIYNDGSLSGSATLTISDSTLNDNAADFGGGGIYNDGYRGSATLTISNSTVSDNSAFYGGGIYNEGFEGSAMLTISSNTLSGNWTIYPGVGGGIFLDNATLTLGDTILKTGVHGANICNYYSSGTVTSLGYNLSDDDGGGLLIATGDQINTDPTLGPLQDNGGPTFTHALLPGSPAIDAGDPSFTSPPDYDQRGTDFLRVFNGRLDIGAFEVQPVTPAYAAQVLPPINTDGTSVFSASRGVVPVKFNLTQDGVATCDLPAATIAVTRISNGVTGAVNESVYSNNADTGSNFRIDSCQYIYNLNSRALGLGIYRVDILISDQVAGSATFELR
jgi:hypothetical protein